MSTRIRTAVILAGGLGSRLLPLTRAVPKEPLPVWKRPVLDDALEGAPAAGIGRVVIVTAPGKEALQANIAVAQRDEARPAATHPAPGRTRPKRLPPPEEGAGLRDSDDQRGAFGRNQRSRAYHLGVSS
jgi:CTP:molybdopterin cytidylyltransferase MocA